MSDKIKFEKSKVKGKKYTAILPDGRKVNFGDIKYEHFRDDTPLKLYSNLDHHDKKRRELYYVRHPKDYPKYSPDWFSKHYLWRK